MSRFTILCLVFALALVKGQNLCANVNKDVCDEVCCPFDGSLKTTNTQCACQTDAHCAEGYACCVDAGQTGTCYDKRTQSCCEYYNAADELHKTTYTFWPNNAGTQHCCQRGGPKLLSQRCDCYDDADCNVATTKSKDPFGHTKCCATIKDDLNTNDVNTKRKGSCYNPSNDLEKCCERRYWLEVSNGAVPDQTKLIYNPNTQQCCNVDGVIASDVNCRCNANSECSTGTCCYSDLDKKENFLTCSQHCIGNKNTNCQGRCTLEDQTCNAAGCGILKPYQECCTYESRDGHTVYDAYNTQGDNKAKCCMWNATKGEETVYGLIDNIGVQDLDTHCPCRSDSDCGDGSTCCFTEDYDKRRIGQCTLPNESCCKRTTGEDNWVPDQFYDPEDKVCCKINGPSNLNTVVDDYRQCVCATDADCEGTGGTCCVSEKNKRLGAHNTVTCDAEHWVEGFITHPQGACPGKCINTDFQECCGQHDNVCWSEYQNCCADDTEEAVCCNKYTETCRKFYTRSKVFEEDEHESCSAREHWTPTIVYFSFVFPILLALISIGLFIVAVINALRSEGDRMLTIVLIVVSIFALLVGILVLFSPVWKFALVCLITNIIILNACQVGGVWSRRFAVILAIVCFLYIIDPFSGNALLSFHAWNRGGSQDADGDSAGLQWAVRALLYQDGQGGEYDHKLCYNYYNFFELEDANHGDPRRFPSLDTEKSWGFCKRGWLHAIGVMSGLLIIFEVLIILIAIALIPRKAFVFDEKTGQIVPIQDPVGSA